MAHCASPLRPVSPSLEDFSGKLDGKAPVTPGRNWSAVQWTAALEGWPGAVGPQRVAGVAMEEAVALVLACGLQPRRPLLRWRHRWRRLRPRQTARQLLAAGVPHGPALGQRLRALRAEAIGAAEPKAAGAVRSPDIST